MISMPFSVRPTMRAALLYGVQDLRLVHVPKPLCEPDGLIVRVTACGLCPTDLRKYITGDDGSLKLPMNLGHEWVGYVEEAGPETFGFVPGRRVIGDTYDGYAEYAPISGETIKLSFPHGPLNIPDHISDEELTFVEPLADCIHAVADRAGVEPGDSVVICGAGQMGLQTISVARIYGGKVIVSEPDPARRDLARQFGAWETIDPSAEDAVQRVRELTDAKGASVVILTIGVPSLVNEALQMAAHLGRVVLFGGFPRPGRAEFDPNLIHYKEIILTGSEWIGVEPFVRPELYQVAVDMLAQGKVPVDCLISRSYPLQSIQEAYEAAQDKRHMKIIISMNS